jgi:hypothetical protein
VVAFSSFGNDSFASVNLADAADHSPAGTPSVITVGASAIADANSCYSRYLGSWYAKDRCRNHQNRLTSPLRIQCYLHGYPPLHAGYVAYLPPASHETLNSRRDNQRFTQQRSLKNRPAQFGWRTLAESIGKQPNFIGLGADTSETPRSVGPMEHRE